MDMNRFQKDFCEANKYHATKIYHHTYLIPRPPRLSIIYDAGVRFYLRHLKVFSMYMARRLDLQKYDKPSLGITLS
jgi:hypothetical protein